MKPWTCAVEPNPTEGVTDASMVLPCFRTIRPTTGEAKPVLAPAQIEVAIIWYSAADGGVQMVQKRPPASEVTLASPCHGPLPSL